MEVCCQTCGQPIFLLKENKSEVVGEVQGKRTLYDTSQGKELEIEFQCPKCESIDTVCLFRKEVKA